MDNFRKLFFFLFLAIGCSGGVGLRVWVITGFGWACTLAVGAAGCDGGI